MTDQMIPAGITPEEEKKAREWADDVLEGRAVAIVPIEETIARALRAYLPPPPRPTLADMTDEERDDCQRMQADVKGAVVRAVILNPDWEDGRARVMWEGGLFEWIDWSDVTPRPDLPRLEWPGTEKPAPAPALPDGWRLADHVTHGRVIVTNSTPDTEGDVYFVAPDHHPTGYDWSRCSPDDLTYIDTGQKPDTTSDVPPNTLAKGSEWDDADALTRACRESGRGQIVVSDCEGDVSVWGAVAGWWESGTPSDGYEPFTIIHAGKGGDQ